MGIAAYKERVLVLRVRSEGLLELAHYTAGIGAEAVDSLRLAIGD